MRNSIKPHKDKKFQVSSNTREKCKLALMKLFQARASVLMTKEQILRNCMSTDRTLNWEQLDKVFEELKQYDYIVPSTNERYKLNKKIVFQGTLHQNRNGKIIFQPDGESKAFFYVHPKLVNNSLPGDYVRAALMPVHFYAPQSVQVLQMIRRSKEVLFGTIQPSNAGIFVKPFSPALNSDIFIRPDKEITAKGGEIVEVRVISWAKKDKCPTGVILKVLEHVSPYAEATFRLAAKHGLRIHFNQSVLQETEMMSGRIDNEEISARKDLRGISTFTIDPDDAKDFDDALSLLQISDDTWQVGIHIADVSHYVHEKSLIDAEAKKRTRSVYFNSLVIPMLPERLSNDICSLQPGQDKLCFSILLTINNQAKILDHEICKTVIHSQKRFTYKECDELLSQDGEGNSTSFGMELKQMFHLATILRAEREKKGSFTYDTEDVHFLLNDSGHAVNTIKTRHGESHILVEEFMLCGNRIVAEFISQHVDKNIPCIYRVEAAPTNDQKDILADKLHQARLPLTTQDPFASEAFEWDETHSKQEKDYAYELLSRSLPKATYSTQNIGHFGLAFDIYTHFTSPIRRYSDLFVHRILSDILKDKETPCLEDANFIASECTKQEAVVVSAEKEECVRLSTEFLSLHIGNTFRCIVTSVQRECVWVEICAIHKSAILKRNTLKKNKFAYNKKKNEFIKTGNYQQHIHEGMLMRLEIHAIDYKKNKVFMDFHRKRAGNQGRH